MNSIQTIWSKINRRVSKYARHYVLIILYYVLLPIIALAGSKMKLQKPTGESMWMPWHDTSGERLISIQTGKNWVRHYVSWLYTSKNLWALLLLPFILMLKATEDSEGATTPELLMIYTLF